MTAHAPNQARGDLKAPELPQGYSIQPAWGFKLGAEGLLCEFYRVYGPTTLSSAGIPVHTIDQELSYWAVILPPAERPGADLHRGPQADQSTPKLSAVLLDGLHAFEAAGFALRFGWAQESVAAAEVSPRPRIVHGGDARGAPVVIFITWARRAGDGSNPVRFADVSAIQTHLQAAYPALAEAPPRSGQPRPMRPPRTRRITEVLGLGVRTTTSYRATKRRARVQGGLRAVRTAWRRARGCSAHAARATGGDDVSAYIVCRGQALRRSLRASSPRRSA